MFDKQYSLKDIAEDKFVLLNEGDMLNIEGVTALTTRYSEGELKIITIHVGIWNYLFGNDVKTALSSKLRKDIPGEYTVAFGI